MQANNLADAELAYRARLFEDFEEYAEFALKIRTKEGSIVPLILNDAQQYAHKLISKQKELTRRVRVIILKGRQQGLSTYTEGRFYWRVTHGKGLLAYILTHEDKATQNIFKMASRYHEHCPSMLKPVTGKTNANELVFPVLDSGYQVGTAGNKSTGRSGTTQYFHGSEVAFWPHASEHAKGVMQTVPDVDGTEIILESTANGLGNYFHQQWQLAVAGESEYIAIFIPWFWQKEYVKPVPANFKRTDEEQELIDTYHERGLRTNEQLMWRRLKIASLAEGDDNGTWAFRQEYPNTPDEAFRTANTNGYISPETVVRCRENQNSKQFGGLILGVDPARFGDDRTSFIYRRGRVAFGLKSYSKKDTMQVTGLVVREIEAKNKTPNPIVRVMVDVGGLGAGVVDRLRELGYGDILTAVNSADSALEDERYGNKRAEMWGEMLKWMKDSPCKIPDKDSLQADLCACGYYYDSKGRLMMEKKENMKKNGFLSPDEGDSLALTFAHPVGNSRNRLNKYNASTGVADSRMGF